MLGLGEIFQMIVYDSSFGKFFLVDRNKKRNMEFGALELSVFTSKYLAHGRAVLHNNIII